LLEIVEQEPQDLGFEFGRWTGERLATYLAEQTGIQLSGSQGRMILKRKKYSFWAKRVLHVSTRTVIAQLKKVDVLSAVNEPILEQLDLQQVKVDVVPVKLIAEPSPLGGELD